MGTCGYGPEDLLITYLHASVIISPVAKRKSKKQKKQSMISRQVGNLLLLSSVLLFFILFYPIISVYLFPPKVIDIQNLPNNYISVPKIHAQAPLNFNVDPFNETEYQEVLKKGVAHAKNTSLPGEKGSMFIFAHSSGNPIEISNYNTIFLKLGELQKNDEIQIKKDNKIYTYKVTEKKVVWPNEVKYLKEEKDQLILQTCWPIGTSLKRLLIFASPEK